MKRITLLAVFTLAALITINSCSDGSGLNFKTEIDNTDHAVFENFSHFVGINNQTRFILEGINGSIKISPTNEIAATITGERKVQSESVEDATNYLELLKVVVEDRGDEVYVYTDQPGDTDGRILTVNYIIKIPTSWNTVISNTNGGLQIDSISGNINVNIVNGSIVLNEINASVNLELVNGTILSQIILPDDGTCLMDLTNGTIGLSIPQATNATLNAGVINGSVNVTDINAQNIASTTSSFEGTLGTGTGTIDLDAVNGDINVDGY